MCSLGYHMELPLYLPQLMASFHMENFIHAYLELRRTLQHGNNIVGEKKIE